MRRGHHASKEPAAQGRVVQSGHAQNLQPFQVAWRYAVLPGNLLTGLFPHVAHPWPTDITVLAASFGRTAVFRIRLGNARGSDAFTP